MKLKKATSRIYYLPGNSDTDRPYLYYINGEKYSVAIDAGNSKKHVETFYQALTEAGLSLPKYTIITHWHWDHTFGLYYINGTSIGSEMTKDKLLKVSKWKWTNEKMQEREKTGEDIAFCNKCIQKEYQNLSDIQVKTVDIGIKKPIILDAGDIHIHLIPHDSTHSRDALFIFVPEEKSLFVGDGDCEDHYENNGAIDQSRLISMIRFIENLDFEHYFIGHDKPDCRDGALKYLHELEHTS
ncbi:MAG: MBL fold metallo-hydrolase [bacterium]|nr:MBL fold metallo-hydrolase [bacterium]